MNGNERAGRNERWEWFWARHSNPRSGWSRVPAGPLLVLALYRRDRRLLALAVGWTVLNPILFAEPERTDDWMSRGVLGEKQWIEDENPLFATRGPGLLNALSAPAFVYTLVAAYRRDPVGATVGLAVSMTLKLYFVEKMVRYYDTNDAENAHSEGDWLSENSLTLGGRLGRQRSSP